MNSAYKSALAFSHALAYALSLSLKNHPAHRVTEANGAPLKPPPIDSVQHSLPNSTFISFVLGCGFNFVFSILSLADDAVATRQPIKRNNANFFIKNNLILILPPELGAVSEYSAADTNNLPDVAVPFGCKKLISVFSNPICALAVNCPDIISVNRTKLPAAYTANLRKSPFKKRFFLTAARCFQPVFMRKTSGLKELYTTKIGCFHQTPPGKHPFFMRFFGFGVLVYALASALTKLTI
jgi:hypothetical protein